MDINKIFGNRLRQIRAELEITQEELALKCDMQPSHIGQLERGIKSPTLETLYKIASGINIDVSDLVNFRETLEVPNNYDEQTNKIIAQVQKMSVTEKKRILTIVKTFRK
jgi:transcriptional regulator with XRE-family HTH domain